MLSQAVDRPTLISYTKESNKMAGKAKAYFEVSCNIHGTAGEKNVPNFKRLTVGVPSSLGKAKRMGCPVCKKVKSQEAQ
ncbi:hypothetical protein phiK7A1_055 [Pseudomonas phage phiK7A1]|uniref:Uncharacterized protein n=1 Tax=Pseudomonas phage phiK7A1 TaxID=2759194 RepID=A0A7H0XFQ5_9CAUD|nr:hypothetical protein phiK7A1_055 [Pseudomonas phage phiK7A1]